MSCDIFHEKWSFYLIYFEIQQGLSFMQGYFRSSISFKVFVLSYALEDDIS